MWVKGQSGNVKGRPPVATALATAVRDKVPPDELVTIALGIAKDSGADARDRLAAVNFLADRGWGRPLQAVELSAAIGRTETQVDTTAVLARLSTAALREIAAAQAALESGTESPTESSD